PTSNSITGCKIRFPQPGAISVMKMAPLMPSGAATIAANKVTASEQKINGNAPYCGSFKFVGFQFLLVKNSSGLIPFTIKDCKPFIVKNAVIANVAIMSITVLYVTSNVLLNSPVTSFLLVFIILLLVGLDIGTFMTYTSLILLYFIYIFYLTVSFPLASRSTSIFVAEI